MDAHYLQQQPSFAEQHAGHLYWYRCYRYLLHDNENEERYILSPSESYQEERIWLTEYSNHDWLENNEVLQQRYADHYQRYRFYHYYERISGDEDDFFLT